MPPWPPKTCTVERADGTIAVINESNFDASIHTKVEGNPAVAETTTDVEPDPPEPETDADADAVTEEDGKPRIGRPPGSKNRPKE